METLFRAKRKDNGEWVYWNVFGQIVCDDGKTFNFITYFGVNYWNIVDLIPLLIAQTVGQWTGLTDKNEVKIFEGDIVKFKHDKEFCGRGIYFRNYEIQRINTFWSCSLKKQRGRHPKVI